MAEVDNLDITIAIETSPITVVVTPKPVLGTIVIQNPCNLNSSVLLNPINVNVTPALEVITSIMSPVINIGLKKHSQDIGDGVATSYIVTHNFNTRDVKVTIYRNSGSYDEVIANVEHTTPNSVTIKFATAPTNNQFRVVVIS